MICPNCGNENIDIAQFCFACGTRFESPAVNKRKPRPAPIIIVVCAAVFIMLMFTGTIGFSGLNGNGSTMKNLITIYDYSSETSYLIYDGKVLDKRLDGSVYDTAGSEDGSTWMIGCRIDHAVDLYSLRGGAVDLIASDVGRFNMSKTGNYALYLQDEALYHYDFSKGSKTRVIDGMESIRYLGFSPDGKTCVYTASEDYTSDSELYVYKNGKNIRIGESLEPIAISSNGGLYYYDGEREALYYTVVGSDKKTKIVSGSSYQYCYVTNYEQTQVIFVVYENGKDEGKAYFTEKGGEKTRIKGIDSNLSIIYPNAQYYSMYPGNYKAHDLRKEIYQVYGSGYYSSNICVLNKDMEAERLVKDVEDVWLSGDKKTLYYSKSDSLYHLRLDSDKGADRIARNINYFGISKDGETAYYINDDEELCYVKGEEEPVKIADDVDRLQLAGNGTIFFLADVSGKTGAGSLYSCKKGKDKQLISDEVYSFSMYSDSCMYSVRLGRGEYDIYVGKEGKKISLELKEIDISYN